MKFVGTCSGGSEDTLPVAWKVTLDGRKLARHTQLREHSEGFAWGYSGSGPAQLALAILVEYLTAHPEDLELAIRAYGIKNARDVAGVFERVDHWIGTRPRATRWSDEEKRIRAAALIVYQRFKVNVVAQLDRRMPWVLEDRDIHSALQRMANEDPKVSEIAEIGQFKGIVTHGKDEQK